MMMILMLSSKCEMPACPSIIIIFARTEFPTEELDVWLQQTYNEEENIHHLMKNGVGREREVIHKTQKIAFIFFSKDTNVRGNLYR